MTNTHGNMGVMSPAPSRDILAANLRRLIDADTPKGQRPSVRAWALGKGLDVRLVDRLTKGQHAVTLDKLEEIAQEAEATGRNPLAAQVLAAMRRRA